MSRVSGLVGWTMARQFASLTGPKVILMLLVPGAHVENPSPLAQWIALLPSGEELELCFITELLFLDYFSFAPASLTSIISINDF